MKSETGKGDILLALIPVTFFVICAVVIHELAPDMPNIIRFNAYAASITIGIALTGPKLMKKHTHSEEELLWAYSSLIGISALFFFFMNVLNLLESGVLTAGVEGSLLFFTVTLPTMCVALFLGYEILDSRRTKRKLLFRLKRFSGRVFVGLVFTGSIILVFRLISFFTSDRHVFLFAFVFLELLLLFLVFKFRELRELLDKLTKGEW